MLAAARRSQPPLLRRWLSLKPQVPPASSSNAELGAQLFGEEEWAKLQQEPLQNLTPPPTSSAPEQPQFQFHNRRGRIPVSSDRDRMLDDRFGARLVPRNEFLYGHHPVELALRFTDPRILSGAQSKLYIQDGSLEQLETSTIRQLAKQLKVPYEITSKMRLDEACGGQFVHQGVVLDLPKQEFAFVDSEQAVDVAVVAGELERKRNIILCLDEFTDSRTLGAVLRSALFFNVHAVIVSAKNSAGLDPALCKASAGASLVLNEQRRLFATHNMVRTLQSQRRKGWRVVAVNAGNATTNKQQQRKAQSSLLTVDELCSGSGGGEDKVCLVVGDRAATAGGALRSLVADQCEPLDQLNAHSVHARRAIFPETKREFPYYHAHSSLSVSNLVSALLARLS